MRRVYCLLFLLVFTMLVSSCQKQQVQPEEKPKPVRIAEAVEETKPKMLYYTGMVASDDIKKLSFKSSGKISKIYVQKGRSVKKGDVLAQLDTKDLELALKAAQAQVSAAQAQYDKAVNGASSEDVAISDSNLKKAQDAYNFSLDNYKKTETLYNAGAISKSALDQAKLDLDLNESDLKIAFQANSELKSGTRAEDKEALLGQLNAAKADMEQKQSLLEDAAIRADYDGYVTDVLCKEGEMVSAGMPVVVLRAENEIINVGISQEDLSKVRIGTKADIKIDDKSVTGEVANIAQVPDSQTRTYNIEIALSDSGFSVGSFARVELIIGDERGIWVPIDSIVSNGDDYIYVVRDDTAEKRKITLGGIVGSSVRVEGISAGEKYVVDGMTRIKNMDRVSVQQ